MGWTLGSDLAAFAAAARRFLDARPVENSVPLTVLDTLLRGGADAYGDEPPTFAWWRGDEGGVAGAALCTPPFPPLLTRMPTEAARDLAALWPYAAVPAPVAVRGPAVSSMPVQGVNTEAVPVGPPEAPGVNGERVAATAFARAWHERTGMAVAPRRESRLYRLGALTPRVPAPPGRARVAAGGDRALLVRWQGEFAAEIGAVLARGERTVDDALVYGGRTVWELPGGEPAAVAGTTRPSAGTVRIVAVYTPPEHRGRGYAGAATAAASQAALDAGATGVVLFADLANPVSNALYQHLGFAPVADFTEFAFTRD